MLSHLRFHRRGSSNPVTPSTDRHQLFVPSSSHDPPAAADSTSPSDARPASSGPSARPPVLPPIPRVTSADAADMRQDWPWSTGMDADSRSQRSQSDGNWGFVGGAALRKHSQQSGTGSDTLNLLSDGQPGHQCSEPVLPAPAAPPHVKAETRPATHVEQRDCTSSGLGRRPAAMRVSTDVPAIPPSSGAADLSKGKKGLPFLKNPMSTLLMRRRNNQNAPDLRLLPTVGHAEQPSYDPRIKGTRVHDFSAPRPKQTASGPAGLAVRSSSQTDVMPSNTNRPTAQPCGTIDSPMPSGGRDPPNSSSAAGASYSESTSAGSQLIHQPPSSSPEISKDTCVEQMLAADDGRQGPPVPPKDDVAIVSKTSSSASPAATLEAALSRQTGSLRTLSRFEFPALPKHMKSTSSRFSFDMVGAAKQEKILEERHRQRELKKKTTSAGNAGASGFDDSDGDDYDYDAMMDDDGLEERIPGVNADLEADAEEDELDSEDDQEGFSGFVFERSDPASSLTCPDSTAILFTPSDAAGGAIGCAVTENGASLTKHPSRSQAKTWSQDCSPTNQDGARLRFQSPSAAEAAGVERAMPKDELYFDDGMVCFEDEFAEDLAAEYEVGGEPFDESIFDNNDTDEFGRPVPGAFVPTQSLWRGGSDEKAGIRRDSERTSRLSAHSGTSQSTAHTSLSAEAHIDGSAIGKVKIASREDEQVDATEPEETEQDSVAAYQAALAAAAHQAAASGRFRRPRLEEGSSNGLEGEFVRDDADDYGHGYVDMDDAELGDDAIIAEANASALAHDPDGWYGQEFGFYSAPQQTSAHCSNVVDYEYANGGVFGSDVSAGVGRSTSGRMASREPNLTPITEQSEYSNRNSVMGFPPLSSSASMLPSPGLAQLAMMAERGDDQMSLSALLQLRSRPWGSQASLPSSREASPRSDGGELPSSSWGSNGAYAYPGAGGNRGCNGSAFPKTSRDYEGPSAFPPRVLGTTVSPHWRATCSEAVGYSSSGSIHQKLNRLDAGRWVPSRKHALAALWQGSWPTEELSRQRDVSPGGG
ncbi:hypothetical protein RJ55_00025 [Drechmeria coniospora]|nr:hypothetical protein RJ55_00025 [Drechmeria coniospora]